MPRTNTIIKTGRNVMNKISGKVVLKETNIGIPDLLVEIYDVDPGIRPEENLVVGDGSDGNGIDVIPGVFTRVAHVNLLGDRLGSVLTDNAGFFKLDYDDADFRRRRPEEQRPDLLLIIRAPEDMELVNDANVLHVSKDLRQNAGLIETYIIRISSSKLITAGIAPPTAIKLDTEEPDAIIQKVNLSVNRRIKVKTEIQKIAAQQVAAERQRITNVEKEIEKNLIEKLTGIPANEAERLNYVPPGGDVEKTMFSAVKKTIENKINKTSPVKGYLVLTESQMQSFKKADGTFRNDIRAEELEPFLFNNGKGGQRPNFLVRENPIELLRQTQKPLSFSEQDASNESNRGSTNGITDPSLSSSPLSPEAVIEFIGKLIDTMTSPEEAVAFGVKSRADQDAVQDEISGFKLNSGPADVPAFYDFHSLQIAFDYVWQKAIDEGIIESSKALARQLEEMGGDPLESIKNNTNLIKALREELRIVQTAHDSGNLPSISARINEIGPEGGDGSGPDPDEDIPLPPKPPHTTGGTRPSCSTSGTLSQDRKPAHELFAQIEELLNERFSFEIFAPGSVNFGILVSYRQRWTPINYQVGDLLKTITLTPKETRKVTTKRVVKKERSIKEMENSLRIRKEEANITTRDEAEIIAKAEAKTNFSLTAQGTYNLGFTKGDSTTVFGKDAATNSSDTKKAFREAVIKAAQEYKDERKIEVESKDTYEEEVTETSEITNPNDELPVTYLYYELQRRFKISECIHRLTPVVLVAMDVPGPGRREIDALLLTYGWIIDRVLLDDQFRKPLEYFRTKLVGDEFALTTMVQNLVVMRQVVDELKRSYTQSRNKSNTLADLLNAQIIAKAQITDSEKSEGFLEKAWESVVGEGDEENKADSIEAARILEDAARERYERAVNQERELRTQLDSETAALKAANDAYARALAEHLNCLMDVGTLRLHIKENILYYMQAIWSHTFKDIIFLLLHKKKAPRLTPREITYRLSVPDEPPASIPSKPGQVVVEVSANVRLESELDPNRDFADLAEVADLDNLLGFKGNYLIFPLRESNALTDFMMTPFVDSELGLRDPDELGNWTPQEFITYARALHAEMQKQLQDGEITQEDIDAAVERLSDQFRRLLSAPRRAEDEITVPTDSLYIEALPGAHPILEDFKLMHRAVDVKKVQAEVRKIELENLRYAARILEGEREDPDIERKIVISGNGEKIVVPPVEN